MPRASAVRRRALLLVVAISLATLITVTATATPPDPAVYLTDDLAAKATVHAVTALQMADAGFRPPSRPTYDPYHAPRLLSTSLAIRSPVTKKQRQTRAVMAEAKPLLHHSGSCRQFAVYSL